MVLTDLLTINLDCKDLIERETTQMVSSFVWIDFFFFFFLKSLWKKVYGYGFVFLPWPYLLCLYSYSRLGILHPGLGVRLGYVWLRD
jgi:hypothetical protein